MMEKYRAVSIHLRSSVFFLCRSTVLSLSHGNALLDGENHDPLLMSSELTTGTHVSSCGHTMHADCWQRYDH